MRKYDKEWLEELCANSYSYAEVLRKAGRAQGGGAQATLKKKIEEFEVDISHFTGMHWQASPNQKPQVREKYEFDEIFVKNSSITQKVLRGYVERHQVLEYRCVNCGCNGEWQGGKIALEIIDISDKEIKCTVKNGGDISNHKSINICLDKTLN